MEKTLRERLKSKGKDSLSELSRFQLIDLVYEMYSENESLHIQLKECIKTNKGLNQYIEE